MAGNLRAFLAEFIGTFALVFIGASAVCMDALTGGGLGLVGTALAYGFALAVMIHTYGHVSGGHFNPAVTAAMMVTRRLGSVRGIFYVLGQLLGAASAGLLLKAVAHNHSELSSAPLYLGACSLSGIGYKAGTLLEAVCTFFLVGAVCAASDPRASRAAAGLTAGLLLAAAVLAIGPLTGAALNPARAFGPSVATGHWNDWYVYWIGPLTGAIASAWIYENLYLEKKR